MKVKQEPDIKEEPADPEDEDIAEEIAEDRLNQIIKDEMVYKFLTFLDSVKGKNVK